MTEQAETHEALLELEELQRRAADLTRELGNINYTLRQKRRELDELKASLEARVEERTRDLEAATAQIREADRLKSIFWTIE